MRRQDAPDRKGPFWRAFADVKAEVDWKRIEVRKGFAYYLPEGWKVKNLVFVRNGLYLGEIRKDRFEPSQAFAMVLQKKFASSIDFPAKDERVIRYLKGKRWMSRIWSVEKRKAGSWSVWMVTRSVGENW